MSTEVVCRPLPIFPPEFHRPQQSSRFRAPWSDTLALVRYELYRLGAREGFIELGLTDADIRGDGWPRASARTSHPGVVLSFESRHGHLRYGTDTFPHWQENLRAIGLGLEALRAVDRYGIGKRGEQYVGWKQLTAGPASEPGMVERGRRLIEQHGSVRAAIKATHPDLNPDADPDDFIAVTAAEEAAR